MQTRGAVIFDFDGTLTKPLLDFDVIRKEIGVTGPILEALITLEPDKRRRAEHILAEHEWNAAQRAELQDGANEVLEMLRARRIPIAILTRNTRATVTHVMNRFGLSVDALRTREDGAIKPAAEPVLALCAQLDADPAASWMIGDYLFDIQSGRAAGTRTVLLVHNGVVPSFADQANQVIHRLGDLMSILM